MWTPSFLPWTTSPFFLTWVLRHVTHKRRLVMSVLSVLRYAVLIHVLRWSFLCLITWFLPSQEKVCSTKSLSRSRIQWSLKSWDRQVDRGWRHCWSRDSHWLRFTVHLYKIWSYLIVDCCLVYLVMNILPFVSSRRIENQERFCGYMIARREWTSNRLLIWRLILEPQRYSLHQSKRGAFKLRKRTWKSKNNNAYVFAIAPECDHGP